MPQENQPSDPKRDRKEDSQLTSSTNATRLSETECDRKAMLFWCGAGKPEGQYSVYRKAVERWNKDEAIEGEFEQYLRRSRNSFWRQFPKSAMWPWLTALIVPVVAASVAVLAVMHEVRVNREMLQTTVEVQREQNRQQILKDYISQMTDLISNKNLASKYPKNEKGDYDPKGMPHPDAIAASSLTKAVLKLLDKKNPNIQDNINNEKGALLVFIYSSNLINTKKTVINLEGARFHGANLEGENLKGANLKGAEFMWANFRFANLSHSDLSEVILYQANMPQTILNGADLREALMLNTNLKKASLASANLSNAKISEVSAFSVFYERMSGNKINPADISGADLFESTLIGVNLTGVNVTRTNLRRSKGLTPEQKSDLKKRGALVDSPTNTLP